MYKADFEIQDGMNKSEGELLKNLDKILDKRFEELKESLYDSVEGWIEERYENVRYKYFKSITRFLLGETEIARNKNVKDWLKELGYDAKSFRKKIYEENKEEILETLKHDALFELIENLFSNSYFKFWEFDDLNQPAPQSKIVKGFLRELIKTKGFNETLKNMLDEEIREKLDELKSIEMELSELKNSFEEIKGEEG